MLPLLASKKWTVFHKTRPGVPEDMWTDGDNASWTLSSAEAGKVAGKDAVKDAGSPVSRRLQGLMPCRGSLLISDKVGGEGIWEVDHCQRCSGTTDTLGSVRILKVQWAVKLSWMISGLNFSDGSFRRFVLELPAVEKNFMSESSSGRWGEAECSCKPHISLPSSPWAALCFWSPVTSDDDYRGDLFTLPRHYPSDDSLSDI